MTATPRRLKIAAVPVVAVVVALGVVLAGRASDDMDVAMAVTVAWFGAAGLACVLAVRARRDLFLPVLGSYAAVVVAIAGYLGYASLVDREVNEDVAVGTPAAQVREAGPGGAPGSRNVQLSGGGFESGAHETAGTAAVVRLAEGGRVLTLTNFRTDPGPDLRVYLAADRGAEEFEDLGALKGNVGNQQYEIPEGVDLDRLATVVIWCRAFSVEFGSAPLAPS